MDKFFNSAYRGDPGVPHSGPDRFVNVWIGSIAFSVLSHFHPYMWQLTNQQKLQFCTSRLSVLIEAANWRLRHWKKAMAKKQPYNFKWNQMDKEVQESYYFNWPVYFP